MGIKRWQKILQQAQEARQAEMHHQALQLCDQAAMLGDEARYHAALLRGEILLELGDTSGALSSFEAVADPAVPDPRIDRARGLALFEMCRFAEAENALESALLAETPSADVYFTLGLMAELQHTGEESELFRMARRLAPETYPAIRYRSTEEFEKLVHQARDRMPKDVLDRHADLQIIVMDLPRLHDLAQALPPMSPRALATWAHVTNLPVAPGDEDKAPEAVRVIVLYKRSLERQAHTTEALQELITMTLLDELDP